MRTADELAKHVPWGLSEGEYVALALLCLDQAGLSVHAQTRVADIARASNDELAIPEWRTAPEPSPPDDDRRTCGICGGPRCDCTG